MDNISPKLNRIAIIGTPGSGKSTLALKLGPLLNIPVHHLDKHQFDGKKKTDKETFMTIQKSLLTKNSWIIEGCSQSTFEMRIKEADTVIYLQFPRYLCFWRSFKRPFIQNKTLTDSGCIQGINWIFIKYIWNFEKKTNPVVNELKIKYPLVHFYTFKKQSDVDQFLKSLYNAS